MLQGEKLESEWNSALAEYEKKYPEEAAEFKQLISGELPDGWDSVLPTYTPDDKVHCSMISGADGGAGQQQRSLAATRLLHRRPALLPALRLVGPKHVFKGALT